MDRFIKKTGETLSITINFIDALGANETISAANISIWNGDIEVEGIVLSSTIVSPYVHIQLTGGVENTTYVVKCLVITSDSNYLDKNVEMRVEDEVALDQQIEDVKTLSGLTDEDDNKIELLTSIALDSICDYCNNDFVAKSLYGYTTEHIDGIFSGTTITMTITMDLVVGDYIRIHNTKYNDGLYRIIEISGTIYTVNKKLRAETINMKMGLVDLPKVFLSIISAYIKNIGTSNIKSEEIDEVKYEYFQSGGSASFLTSNAPILNQFRHLYRSYWS